MASPAHTLSGGAREEGLDVVRHREVRESEVVVRAAKVVRNLLRRRRRARGCVSSCSGGCGVREGGGARGACVCVCVRACVCVMCV